MNTSFVSRLEKERCRISPYCMSLSLFFLVLGGVLPLAPLEAEKIPPGYVQVRSASVRSAPKTWAPLVKTLKYGERVQIVEVGRNWFKVKLGKSKSGYMHRGTLTKKKVVLGSGKSSFDGSAQSSEVVLAGKGYTGEVEEQFKKTGVALNYAAVDRIERRKISESDLQRFRKEGGLE